MGLICKAATPSLMPLLKPYRLLIGMPIALTIAGNGLNLVMPKLISHAIDAYTQWQFVLNTVVGQFLVVVNCVPSNRTSEAD
jgi:ATP-binding cassette, subfamily B, bacterial